MRDVRDAARGTRSQAESQIAFGEVVEAAAFEAGEAVAA